MKKNILLAALVACSLYGLSSCNEDRLDLEPIFEDSFTGKILDEEQMGQYVNSIYNSLAAGSNFSSNIILYGDMVSENVFISLDNTSGYHTVANGLNWSGDSGFSGWRGLYDIIQKANFVILDDNLPLTPEVKSYKGEAKIARGLTYFYLVQQYSSNPTSGQYQEYGVPLIQENYSSTYVASRNTVSEVYDQIIKDLTEGINEMSSTAHNSKTFLSPTAGRLILSKVYLTRGQAGDYDKAVQYADEVLTNSPSNFKLLETSQMTDYFTGTTEEKYEEQPETIFEVEQNLKFTLAINGHLATFYSSSGAHRGFNIRKGVYDLFDDTDLRKNLYNLNTASKLDEVKGYLTKKYPRSVGGNYAGNIKVFRMTEALYVKMEALAKKGESAKALELLNAHATSYGAKAYTGDALTAILLDKQKEFLTEGHRFYDLKRNNLGFDKVTNCNGNCSASSNSIYFVYPISLSERLLNPKMTQHPLWQ